MATLHQSYVHGASAAPLLGDTIGDHFEITAARWVGRVQSFDDPVVQIVRRAIAVNVFDAFDHDRFPDVIFPTRAGASCPDGARMPIDTALGSGPACPLIHPKPAFPYRQIWLIGGHNTYFVDVCRQARTPRCEIGIVSPY